MSDRLSLLDYRRRVHQHYRSVREAGGDPQAVWENWRRQRNELFGSHSQSALNKGQKQSFQGLDYFDYDPSLRLAGELHEKEGSAEVLEIALEDDGIFRIQPFAEVHFSLAGDQQSLQLFWVLGYGGGLFLPFKDATAEVGETYGGGRYLFDTIKGADLGVDTDGRLVLDFNYAYNPSCAYSPRWSCPLAPRANGLTSPIRAGEKAFPS